ncbi:hypothetical protein [uncultured Ilyobacter sp.]|uniref:hypothetical protein n=1 Tax=uncultured Ilyobacter sp. TaxID=544433 RepID=UPI0029C8034C|nr:hypothetical protein [uncultured Ilyobacter sp.]
MEYKRRWCPNCQKYVKAVKNSMSNFKIFMCVILPPYLAWTLLKMLFTSPVWICDNCGSETEKKEPRSHRNKFL